jgi:hypothetical protein
MSIQVVVSSTAAGVSVSGGTAVAITVGSVSSSVPVTVGGGIGPAGFIVNPGTASSAFGTFQLAAGDGITISTSVGQFQIASYGTAAVSSLAPVQNVAGRTGAISLAAADVAGLASVATSGSYTSLQNVPATFSPAAHTHSLADLTQSSATAGQVPAWNGTAWEATTPAAGGGGGGGEDALLRSIFVPPAPTGLTVTPGNAQATVSWTAPTGVIAQAPITDYTVQSKTTSAANFVTFSRAASTATNAIVTGLTNGTAYVFRVASVNAVGTGTPTAESSAVTAGVPSDPFFSSVAALLHMDGTGGTFVDSSGTPKTITAVGATQSATESQWGGKSAFLNGAGHYLQIPGVNIGTGDFAIEMWFKTNSSVQFAQLIGNESAGGSQGFSLLMNNNSSAGGQIAMYSGSLLVSTSSGDWSDDQWHYLALSRSGTTVRLYMDGALASTSTSSANLTSSAPMYVGYNNAFPPRNVVGYFDDIRITVGSARGMTGATVAVPTAAFPDS